MFIYNLSLLTDIKSQHTYIKCPTNDNKKKEMLNCRPMADGNIIDVHVTLGLRLDDDLF